MEESKFKYSKDIYLILAAGFFYMASPMLVTPLIVGFSGELGAGATTVGLVSGLMFLCSLICRPLVGNLTDRLSKYQFATIGSLLMLIATIGYVVAPNVQLVIVLRIINGIGFACCSVCLTTWMSDMLPVNKVGSGMGLYGTMNALSMGIAPAIGVSLYTRIGYRMAFALAAAFTFTTFILVQLVKNKGEPIQRTADEIKQKKLFEIKALPIAIIVMLFAIPYCATQSFLVSYVALKNVPVTVSLFFPLYAAMLFGLRFSLKSKFDQWSFALFFWTGSISALIAFLSLTYLHSNLLLVVAAFFMAGGYGIMCSVSQANAILLAGPGKRGVANATYYVGLDLGMGLGPFLGGVVFGAVPVDLFYPVLMICIPCNVIVYLLWKKRHFVSESR